MKGKTLLLDTDFTGEIKKAKIHSGSMFVDKYEMVIDKSNPILLKTGFSGVSPLYILKWSSLVPIEFERVTKVVPADEANKMIKDEGYMRVDYQDEVKSKGKLRSWFKAKLGKKKNTTAINTSPTMPNPINISPTTQVEYVPTKFEYRKLEMVKPEAGISKVRPELLRDTLDMRFLKGMKKYGAEKGGILGEEGIGKGKVYLIAIGSLIFGFVLFYLIFKYMV